MSEVAIDGSSAISSANVRKRSYNTQENAIDSNNNSKRLKIVSIPFEMISILPTEIWKNNIVPIIPFDDLKSLRLTCKTLFNLISMLWKSWLKNQNVSSFISSLSPNPSLSTKIYGVYFQDYSASDLQMLSSLQSLEAIDLSQTSIPDEGLKFIPSSLLDLNLSKCKNITSTGLSQLPPNLVNLNLSYCESLDESLQYLPSSLTSLSLTGCKYITQINSFPPSLLTLNLSYCLNISSQQLFLLPSKLTSLRLYCCDGITNEGLGQLPSSLILLDIAFCDNITDEGLHHLPSSLQTLNISYCDVSEKGIQELHDTCPNLKIIQTKK